MKTAALNSICNRTKDWQTIILLHSFMQRLRGLTQYNILLAPRYREAIITSNLFGCENRTCGMGVYTVHRHPDVPEKTPSIGRWGECGNRHPSCQEKFQLVNKRIKSLIAKLDTYIPVALQNMIQMGKIVAIFTGQLNCTHHKKTNP